MLLLLLLIIIIIIILLLGPTGTEEIVENIVPQVEEVNLFGREQLPWCDATFKATKYKPWLNEDDSKDVLFVSVHGYGARNLMGQGAFYPGK